MGTVSRHFSFREFEKSDTATRYHINNTIKDWDVRDNIIALVENILQPLRDEWGEPLFINSGYRCKELNEKVGGVETSMHRTGEAADVACSNPYELAKLIKRLGLEYDQVILYPTFVHIAYTRNRENRMQILYNKSYRGKKL